MNPAPAGAADGYGPLAVGDPNASYRRLRENSPVHFDGRSATWLLTRHADCTSVLRDDRFSAHVAQSTRQRADPLPASMLTTDPPDHRRLRIPAGRLVARAHVERCTADVAEAAGLLAERAAALGEFDAIPGYAAPLATIALTSLLGIPAAELGRFAGLARAAAPNLDPFARGSAAEHGRQAADELVDYLGTLLDERRMTPDGGLAALLAGEVPDDPEPGVGRLSRPEVLSLVALVVVGGLDPLTHVIGNGLDTLLRRPAHLRRLREQPHLWATAVDELLRWESPIPFTARVPTVEVTVGGRRIAPGETVVALLAAGNRDPAVFPEPESLDLARSPNPVLAFGAGVHVCLAALLARTVARIALTVVLQRFPGLTALGDEPDWLPCRVPRGLARLALHTGEPTT